MAKATMGPITSYRHMRSFQADGAITRGYAVMAGAAATTVKAADANDAKCIGIADEAAAAAGNTVGVVMHGEVIAIAGAAIARGDRVKVLNGGKLTPGNAADVETVGYAVSLAAADGDEFVLFVLPSHKRS